MPATVTVTPVVAGIVVALLAAAAGGGGGGVIVVVVVVVVVGGSGYVRDGTLSWHCKPQNAVNTSARGF